MLSVFTPPHWGQSEGVMGKYLRMASNFSLVRGSLSHSTVSGLYYVPEAGIEAHDLPKLEVQCQLHHDFQLPQKEMVYACTIVLWEGKGIISYRSRSYWCANFEKEVLGYLRKIHKSLPDNLKKAVADVIAELETAQLRRKVEDYLRQNPEQVRPVAQYLGLTA